MPVASTLPPAACRPATIAPPMLCVPPVTIATFPPSSKGPSSAVNADESVTRLCGNSKRRFAARCGHRRFSLALLRHYGQFGGIEIGFKVMRMRVMRHAKPERVLAAVVIAGLLVVASKAQPGQSAPEERKSACLQLTGKTIQPSSTGLPSGAATLASATVVA